MKQSTIKAIEEHAESCFPKECCGVVVVRKGKEKYVPCRNIATNNEDFILSPDDYAAAEDAGDITAIVHSHTTNIPEPSQADLVACERSGLPWVIIALPSKTMLTFEPSGYKAPLIGREFVHGVLDCYSLVRDYYSQTLNIDIPDFVREDDWWHKGGNLYLDNFEKAGFVQVQGELKVHDGILFQFRSPTPNHAGVYLGDGTIMHHVTGRLSCREILGGYWDKHKVMVVRHKELLDA